jgi:hypothetical protein
MKNEIYFVNANKKPEKRSKSLCGKSTNGIQTGDSRPLISWPRVLNSGILKIKRMRVD